MIIGNFALRLIALLASVAASARSQTDQITGTVTDGSTAAVPNTMVTATDTETDKYVALESALGDSEMMTSQRSIPRRVLQRGESSKVRSGWNAVWDVHFRNRKQPGEPPWSDSTSIEVYVLNPVWVAALRRNPEISGYS
jgi:hypothetical protein